MEESAFIEQFARNFYKASRAISYALAALFLLYSSTYTFGHVYLIALAIGILGFWNATAKVGAFGLGLLLVLALISKDTVLFFAHL